MAMTEREKRKTVSLGNRVSSLELRIKALIEPQRSPSESKTPRSRRDVDGARK
ncbi:MAG: hypothetical protein Q8O19_02240 [Rectinemataceae bacterium]|nr:hypothetical protein [Rectinemataceae bacterium]